MAIMLTSHEIRELRGQLHHLKPIVIIGNNGLTPTVLQEIDRALTDHELIKIRSGVKDREQYNDLIAEICKKTGAIHVQSIGHIIAFYRKNPQTEEN